MNNKDCFTNVLLAEYSKQQVNSVAILTCVLKVLGSNLERDADNPEVSSDYF